MKIYIVSIIVVGVVGSILSIISPEGEGGGLSKHTRLAFGLCLILAVALPLSSFFRELREIDLQSIIPEVPEGEREEYESIFQSSYEKAELENLREGIVTILGDRFGIDSSECAVSVQVSRDGDGVRRLDRIFINLYGSAVWKDTGEIEEYLSSLFSCQVVTAVG